MGSDTHESSPEGGAASSRIRNLSALKSKVLLICCLLGAPFARADIRLPGIFGDHMVLQQGQQIPVWGWGDPGEEVTVALGTNSAKTKAGTDGKWRVDLDKSAANGDPQALIVTGKNKIEFADVLVGDVWVCSGQSNMEFGVFNVAKKEAVVDPQIRTFCVLKSASLTPLDNTESVPPEVGLDTQMGHWQKETPGGPWGGFSAVGYLFAKEIRKITQKPVGMIGSYWGGTPAQAWTSMSGLEKDPALNRYANIFTNLTAEQQAYFPMKWENYAAAMKKWWKESGEPYEKSQKEWAAAAKLAKDSGQPEPPRPQMAFPRPASPRNEGTPTTLFNGMINPLIPYAIKGVIWYQGESNVGTADYGVLFSAMINDWREKWGQGDFPFLFVQLAGYGPGPTDSTRGKWALLRESQTEALKLPNTGMATAIDLGDEKDIHPKNKLDVAKRLALLAGNRVYGQKVVASGPLFSSMKIEAGRIRLDFKNTGGGLVIAAPPVLPGTTSPPAPTELAGFEIAGEDRKWQPAKATIEGNSVIVSSEAVTAPVAARYAWSDFPACSLYNREGLPAFPLRTDDWK